MNFSLKTCLLGFTIGFALFSPLWIIPLTINKPESPMPAEQPPPPTSPLVVYSHRLWLLEGNGTNSLASFLFTAHEWETLCSTLGPAAPDGTLKLPQGSIRRLSPDSFTNLMESLGREAVRTGQVWIVTGGGR